VTAADKLRFEKGDTSVVGELRAAEVLLRDERAAAVPDAIMATLLADALERWRFLGGLDSDLLNRAGGAEMVLLARHINEIGS
jgi:hypothetical protein